MELNECINSQLNNAQNAVFSYFKMMLAEYDVTPIQYALLKCLWTEDMQQPSQLAQSLQLDASTVSGLLDRLEKKGLIERVYNAQDRRGVHVHLLPSGAVLQEPIEARVLKANADITAGISPEALRTFSSLLKVIENNAKQGRSL